MLAPEHQASAQGAAVPVESDDSLHASSAVTPAVMFTSGTILNDVDSASQTHIPLAALFTPVTSCEPDSTPCLRRSGNKCTHCQAYINSWCPIDSSTGVWKCVFCHKDNSGEEFYKGVSPNMCPELVSKTVDYVDPMTQSYNPQKNNIDIIPMVVFVVDACMTKQQLSEFRESMDVIMNNLDPGSRVGLVTFANVATIYELTVSGIASADVLPGLTSPTDEELATIRANLDRYVAPLSQCQMQISEILTALQPMVDQERVVHETKRCMGTAVEVALALFAAENELHLSNAPRASQLAPPPVGGRMAVFLTGSPNFGPGAVYLRSDDEQLQYHHRKAIEYYQDLARSCGDIGVGVDLSCCGHGNFNIPVIQSLCLSNGGSTILHKDFGASFSDNVVAALQRNCGFGGVFDIKTPDSISVTRIIGPAISLAQDDTPGDSRASPNLCRMGGVTPAHCYTVFFELAEDIALDYVHFQFITEYTNYQNQRILRVTTKRLMLTGNPATYLGSVDVEVAAVVIAKRSVLMARKYHDVGPVLDELDDDIREIALTFGRKHHPVAGRSSAGTVYDFPRELVGLPLRLFHLRRGSLLGPILQHPDDIDVIRLLFLHSPYNVCKRIISPQLLRAEADGTFSQFPLETLALQSDLVLLLDHHTDIFIWSGKEATTPGHDKMRSLCRQVAAEAADSRFPVPQILEFSEGSSMGRFLTCRLVPAHKDHPDDQRASFPQLDDLSDDAKQRLVQKFHRTDDPSYREYYMRLFSGAS